MRNERYGERDLTYSQWHRRLDDFVTYIDIDACEYCHRCRDPLVLIELAKDVGQPYKTTTVLRKLAVKAGIRGYLVLYKVNSSTDEIIQFKLQQVSPVWSKGKPMPPEEYANWLRQIHLTHQCQMQSKGC